MPNRPDVDLKDSSGVDVADDIFDELVRSAAVSFRCQVLTGGSGKTQKHPSHCIYM